MRKLLLLALLLYDIVKANKIKNALGADSEEVVSKRHFTDDDKRYSQTDDRRSWRKQSLTKTDDNWEDTEKTLNRDDLTRQGHKRDDDVEHIVPLRHRKRRYNDMDAPEGYYNKDVDTLRKSSKTSSIEKYDDKKSILAMSCNREHEKYEACFAGCASVTCDNPRDRLRPCYPFCEPGCVCVPPRVRDDRTHKCVLPEDCTKGLKGIPDLGMID